PTDLLQRSVPTRRSSDLCNGTADYRTTETTKLLVVLDCRSGERQRGRPVPRNVFRLVALGTPPADARPPRGGTVVVGEVTLAPRLARTTTRRRRRPSSPAVRLPVTPSVEPRTPCPEHTFRV